MGQKRNMPSKQAIKKYWDKDSNGDCRIRFIGDMGWTELPLDSCWKCGEEGYTERCHIVARCGGGSDSVENLHLLCSGCHTQSESFYGFEPGLLYYKWFYSWNYQWFLQDMFCQLTGETQNDKMDANYVETKFIPKWNKMLDDGYKTGKTISDKKTHDRFKKLSKSKGLQFTDYMIHEGIF